MASLVAAFLTVALTPCPERMSSRGGEHGLSAPASGATSAARHATSDGLSLVPACPCGCEKVPVAGSSARLGVALPSTAVALGVTRPATTAVAPPARRIELLAARIEQVPLAGPRIAG
ncbi:MAG TPA: hypothetical protein VMW19_17200 [Myxococcota bacterium]|nr:hypothetical protein [Myxococcota bacterium]